eukprot:2934720-Karenia_brevis.AAC.1
MKGYLGEWLGRGSRSFTRAKTGACPILKGLGSGLAGAWQRLGRCLAESSQRLGASLMMSWQGFAQPSWQDVVQA